MGVLAVIHLYVFPAVPDNLGDRRVRNVAVMTDYPSLGIPPDPEEIVDDMKFTVLHIVEPVERGIGGKNSQMRMMTLSEGVQVTTVCPRDRISSLEGHHLDPHTDNISC